MSPQVVMCSPETKHIQNYQPAEEGEIGEVYEGRIGEGENRRGGVALHRVVIFAERVYIYIYILLKCL